MEFEEPFRSYCCGEDGTSEDCNLFFAQRPINKGVNYMAPRLGKCMHKYIM